MDRQRGKKKQIEETSSEENSSDAFYRQLILAQNAAFAHGAYITQSPFMAPELAVAYSMLDPVYASYSAMMANPWNIAGLCASAPTATTTTTVSTSGLLETYNHLSTKKKTSSSKTKILSVPSIGEDLKRDESTATSITEQNVINEKPLKRKRKSSPVRRIKATPSSQLEEKSDMTTTYSSMPLNKKTTKKSSSRPSLSECLAKMTTCVAASGHNLWSGASAVHNTEGVLDLSSRTQEWENNSSEKSQTKDFQEKQHVNDIPKDKDTNSNGHIAENPNCGINRKIQETENRPESPLSSEDNNNDKDRHDIVNDKSDFSSNGEPDNNSEDKCDDLKNLEKNDDEQNSFSEIIENPNATLKNQESKDDIVQIQSELTVNRENSENNQLISHTNPVRESNENLLRLVNSSNKSEQDELPNSSYEPIAQEDTDGNSFNTGSNTQEKRTTDEVKESKIRNNEKDTTISNSSETPIVKKKKKKKKRKHHKHEDSNNDEKKASIVLKLPKEKILKNDPYAFDEDDDHTPLVQPLSRPIHRNGILSSKKSREEVKSVADCTQRVTISSSTVTSSTVSQSQCNSNHNKESNLTCYPTTSTSNLEEELDDNKLLASINDILTDSERKQQLQNDLKSFSEVLEQLQQQHPPPISNPSSIASSFPYTYNQQPSVSYQSSYKTINYANNENPGYYNTYPSSGAASFQSEINCSRRDSYYGEDPNFQYNTSSSYTVGAYGNNYNYSSNMLPLQQMSYQAPSHRIGSTSNSNEQVNILTRNTYYPHSSSSSHISQQQQYFHPASVRNSNSVYNGQQTSHTQPSPSVLTQGGSAHEKVSLPLPVPPPSSQVCNESKVNTSFNHQVSSELTNKPQSNSPAPSAASSISLTPDKNESDVQVNEESDLVERLRSNTQEEVPSCNCLGSNTVYDERVEGPFYTHLGAAQSIAGIRKLFEERTGLTGKAIRIEKIIYSGKEGKGTQGCPVSKWIIRRSSMEEKVLIVARPRVGHTCPQAVITVNIVVWEGVPAQQADELYDYLRQLLPVYGLQTDRRCGSNEQKTCACQGWKDDVGGASFSFGCSWSMYYNGCKFARSQQPRKFRLKNESHETQLEHALQSLATHLSPIYKQVAPDSFRNQTQFEKDGTDCRLGLESGRPFSGVTACIDYCSHAHRDNHNMNNGSTVVVTLTKHRGLGKGVDEQLHVHPLCVLDPTAEDGTRESRLQQEREGSVSTLSKFEQIVRIRSTPAPCKKKRKAQQEEKRKRGGDMPKKKAPTKAELEQRMRMAHSLQLQMSTPTTPGQSFTTHPEYSNPYSQMACNTGNFSQPDTIDSQRWWNGCKSEPGRDESQRWCDDFPSGDGNQTGHEDLAYNEHLFLDENIGGVALALGHGSVLLECAKREMHSTTALREPNRFHPTRISLVFYQHKNMNYPRHGELQYQQKSEIWKKRREQQQQQQQKQAHEMNIYKQAKRHHEPITNSVRQSADHCVVQSTSQTPRPNLSHSSSFMNLHQQNWNSAPPNAYGFWH